MSRKHQLLIYTPAHDAAPVAALKARLNPFYAVQPVGRAELRDDPWEGQCAALVLLEAGDEGLGYAVEQRIRGYLMGGGNVVQLMQREGPVPARFGSASDVRVLRSGSHLVFERDPPSGWKPLDPTGEAGFRSVEQTIAGRGKIVLTTLTAAEMGQDSERSIAILDACGIQLPERTSPTRPTPTPTAPRPREQWASLPPALLKPTHPLPLIMLVHPERGERTGWDIWWSLAGEGRVVDDENDAFRVAKPEMGMVGEVMESARAAAGSEGGEFARETTVVCPSGLGDALPAMPLFRAEVYFEELARLGRATGQRRSGAETGVWNVGDVVLYGEAVTSTQTMLDRNPKILRGLPTPFLSLATFQLSGRGRGTNQWLSPPGCLQFSLLLALPRAFPAGKLVFVQYLAALAICDGLDPDGKLGVRVKWPNDIYAEAEGLGGTTVGAGKKGRAKIGGVLVNSSFVDGQWRVVVGCGINVLNDLPTTSLAQLYELRAGREARAGGAVKEHASMEKALARVLVSFEAFWNTFLEDQGFQGLIDEYLGRWLHTDQQVTLTTTTPPQALVIKTITLDHGLLRCVPDRRDASGYVPRSSMYDAGSEDRAYGLGNALAGMQSLGIGSASGGFVDLQPDGNSFDLMSGLIKRKV